MFRAAHLLRQRCIDALHDVRELYHQLERHDVTHGTHALVCPRGSLPTHLHAHPCVINPFHDRASEE